MAVRLGLRLARAPRCEWPRGGRVRGAHGFLVLLLCLLYAGLLVAALRQPRGEGDRPGFFSLRGVVALFRHPLAILAAWVHILAFDLMVGWHIRREGAALGIEHGWLLPCYLLAMLFGPLGLLAFFALAAWQGAAGS